MKPWNRHPSESDVEWFGFADWAFGAPLRPAVEADWLETATRHRWAERARALDAATERPEDPDRLLETVFAGEVRRYAEQRAVAPETTIGEIRAQAQVRALRRGVVPIVTTSTTVNVAALPLEARRAILEQIGAH